MLKKSLFLLLQIISWNTASGALCARSTDSLAFSPGTFSTIALKDAGTHIRKIFVISQNGTDETYLWPETKPEEVVAYLFLHVDKWVSEYGLGNHLTLSVSASEIDECRKALAERKPVTEQLNRRFLAVICRGNEDVASIVRQWLPVIPHPLYDSKAPKKDYFSYEAYLRAHHKIKDMNRREGKI